MAILTVTDFSENSTTAVRQAAQLALDRGDDLTVLHCVEIAAERRSWAARGAIADSTQAQWRGLAEQRLEKFFEETVPPGERPHSVSYRVELEYVEDGVLHVAELEDFDLVVIGATGKNRVANFFLGSTPEAVVRRSELPVLVVPHDAEVGSYEHILAPVDFTPCSGRSFERAVSLARAYDARLTVLHAFSAPLPERTAFPTQIPAESVDVYEEQSREHLQSFVKEFNLEGLDWESRHEIGAPHRVIVDSVDELGVDLIVIGTHGRRGLERLFVGSTTLKVLRQMPCSVMTVRTREEDEPETE